MGLKSVRARRAKVTCRVKGIAASDVSDMIDILLVPARLVECIADA